MTNRNKIFLWRGMIGGLIGGLIWSLIAIAIEAISNPRGVKGVLNYVFLLALPAFVGLNIVIGISLGALIGAVVWFLNKRAKQNIGAVTRAVIGTICAFIASIIYSYTRTRGNQEQLSSLYIGFYVAAFSIVVGALSGIIAGTQKREL
jgi:uncharacterized membrane protein YeaQ/YmgE (transglycosylase-associated protein family)